MSLLFEGYRTGYGAAPVLAIGSTDPRASADVAREQAFGRLPQVCSLPDQLPPLRRLEE